MSSVEMFDQAAALFERALAKSRAETALSEARVAKLKAAAELERIGDLEESRRLIAEVRAEQETSA